MELSQTHPQCHAAFAERGEWTVQRTAASFASIACDQAIEQTVNRDSKTSGGLTGRTTRRGQSHCTSTSPQTSPLALTRDIHILALLPAQAETSPWCCLAETVSYVSCCSLGTFERWILAQPDRSAITRQCESLAGLSDDTEEQHRECEPSAMKQHKRAVLSLIQTIDSMVNPFSSSMDGLVSISSGMEANADVARDLLTAREQGEASDLLIS